MFINVTRSATVFQSENGAGYVVHANDLDAFKAFIASIPANHMIYFKKTKANTKNGERATLTIETFEPREPKQASKPEDQANTAAIDTALASTPQV